MTSICLCYEQIQQRDRVVCYPEKTPEKVLKKLVLKHAGGGCSEIKAWETLFYTNTMIFQRGETLKLFYSITINFKLDNSHKLSSAWKPVIN